MSILAVVLIGLSATTNDHNYMLFEKNLRRSYQSKYQLYNERQAVEIITFGEPASN